MLCIPNRIQEPEALEISGEDAYDVSLVEVKHMGMQLALFVKTATTI